MEIFILVIAALAAGFVDAVAGGGGVITFPAFILCGLPISEIVGTNKLVSVSGTSVAAMTFISRGMAQREVVFPALLFTAIGAVSGAAIVLKLPNEFLKPWVSVLVIFVAIYCYFRPELGSEHNYSGLNVFKHFSLWFTALALGFYDGFFGPGTGIFLTFYFVKFLGCDYLRAGANTKILNWTSNIVSLVFFLFNGTVRFDIGIPMIIANVIGGYLGARTAISKGSVFIKYIYISMAGLTALKLFLEMFKMV
ncbi:MAG: sulfite exporter TauE/SafE family protein [Candidatus Rifleibacteriota bacterium]